MNTGYMLMMANLHEGMSDAEMIRQEMRIAEMAEEVGYDAIWCAEHHFETYSIAVDNIQILTWLAARTNNIKLGSAALILPWWTQPIRLVEKNHHHRRHVQRTLSHRLRSRPVAQRV